MTMPDPAMIAQFDQKLAEIEEYISEAVADIQEKIKLQVPRDFILGYIDSSISNDPELMAIYVPILLLKLAEATMKDDNKSATG